MQVNVRYLDNLKLEASFDDFNIIADQPIRYKGDGTAPGPFDYFLASSALCAAYFVKLYCNARNIPTDDIKVIQNNIVDPENRYKQSFHIQIELPATLSEKDRAGIIDSMERCTVKRVIQNEIDFKITAKDILGSDAGLLYSDNKLENSHTVILGKDAALEDTLKNMTAVIEKLGIKLEIASWRNPIPHVWSVHVRDADSPLCYTNGKGATKEAALCSALGEYIERLSNNYFYNDYYLGNKLSESTDFVHYPEEKWFAIKGDKWPAGLMDAHLLKTYNNEGQLKPSHLIDSNSGNTVRGICALPFTRISDNETVYIPVNLIGNLFVSNGMSAGNSKFETRVQCLSEIFERAVKNQIILEELSLPDVPLAVLQKYPQIVAGIEKLEAQGFPVLVKDASLGGKFPVMCVTLMNPRTGGVFASFGAHPKFEVALERSLTELLQGRSFEGLNDVPKPSFDKFAVTEHNNIVDHFVDSTGVVSWKFFSQKNDYEFCEWDFAGDTQAEYHYLMDILKQLEKEVYIADYQDLGAHACRILVPGYSEIYQSEDLIWDNSNKALNFRADILNLHKLNDNELISLIERFEDFDLDQYMPISELIGVAFEEASNWGQLNIAELKALSLLALGEIEAASEQVKLLVAFNEYPKERLKFYQTLDVVLDIEVEAEDFANYEANLNRMFGAELVSVARKSVLAEVKFYGLNETNLDLKGIDKHCRLIESYQKLKVARTKQS